jgi:hypothetical protein
MATAGQSIDIFGCYVHRYLPETLVIPVAKLKKHLHTFEEAKLFDFRAE